MNHNTTPNAYAISEPLFQRQLYLLNHFSLVASHFLESQSRNLGAPNAVLECAINDEASGRGIAGTFVQKLPSGNYSLHFPVTLIAILDLIAGLFSVPEGVSSDLSVANSVGSEQLSAVDLIFSDSFDSDERLEQIAIIKYGLATAVSEHRKHISQFAIDVVTKLVLGHEFAHVWQWHFRLQEILNENENLPFTEPQFVFGAEFNSDLFALLNLIDPQSKRITGDEVYAILWAALLLFSIVALSDVAENDEYYPSTILRYRMLCECVAKTDATIPSYVLADFEREMRSLANQLNSHSLQLLSLFPSKVKDVSAAKVQESQFLLDRFQDATLQVYEGRQLVPTSLLRMKFA